MSWWEALILAIIEGLTEFLPVSSTGHMIIASTWMGIAGRDFVKSYTIIIQLGAILAIVLLYAPKFFNPVIAWKLYYKLIIGFLPVGMMGFLLKDYVDIWLGDVVIVAWALIIGGIVLIILDSRRPKQEILIHQIERVTVRQAFWIGIFQCISLIPGVSRAAATILGGLFQGLSRHTAAEFSFFLAVPTMLAVTGYKTVKLINTIESEQVLILIGGMIVALMVALLAVQTFLRLLNRFGLAWLGWYRIFIGGLILWLIYGVGVPLQTL